MLNNSKIISLILTLVILSSVLINPQTSFASDSIIETHNLEIVMHIVPEKILSYAKESFREQIQDVLNHEDYYKIFVDDRSNIQLSQPMALYNYDVENSVFSETNIYYFPITEGTKTIAIYAVAELQNGLLTGTLSKSFAEAFNKVIQNKTEITEFSLIKVNNTIYLVDNTDLYPLENDRSSNRILEPFENKEQLINNYNHLVRSNALRVSISNSSPLNMIQRYSDPYSDPVALSDYISLNVPIVSSEDMKWSWAATCASIINYKKSIFLTARTIVRSVFDSAINKDGTLADIEVAYNNWGIGMTQYYPLVYYQTKTILKTNTPIHASFLTTPGYWDSYGYSMTIRGFEEYRSTHKYYLLIDPNKNYAVSVTAYDVGNNVAYILNGNLYYWNYARY